MTNKIPRIQILSHFSISVPGSIIAGSLPPSSRVKGVKFAVAATATFTQISAPYNDYSFRIKIYLFPNFLRAYECNVFNPWRRR